MKNKLLCWIMGAMLFAPPAFAETEKSQDETQIATLMCELSSTINGLVAQSLLDKQSEADAENLRLALLQKSQNRFREKFPDDAEISDTLGQLLETMSLPAKKIQVLTKGYAKTDGKAELFVDVFQQSSKASCLRELALIAPSGQK